MQGTVNRAAKLFLIMIALALLSPVAALAQDGGGASTIHYFGAGIGCGIVTIGAGIGIGKFTAAAVESIARQPQAAKDIMAAFQLPLFLLEGVAVIALGVCFVIIFMT